MATPHVFYELLPSYIAPASVAAEREELLEQVHETLARLNALRCDGNDARPLEKRHFRVLQTLFALKHELPKALHLELIHALVDVLWARDGRDFDDVHMELRALSALEWLLTKWTKRSASERKELVLKWRSGWRALERACFKGTGSVRPAAQASLQQLSVEMAKSVEKARKYFAPTDASTPLLVELWREFASTIRATESNECFKALALLSVFAVVPQPTDDETDGVWPQVEALLPEWFATWASVSKCAEWDGHWMKLLSRVAKQHTRTRVWDAYLPFVFAKIHDSLELPSDLGAPFKSNTWPSAYFVLAGTKHTDTYAMRLAVHLLRNPDGETPARANEYVLEILNLMKAFFHPSNVANSADALGVSVYFFSTMLARRLGHEKAAGESLETAAKLSLVTCAPLVDALLELAFFGIYSKNRSVASKCMYLIKNLVCIDPRRCAAPVLQEMMKALDPMAMSHAHLASTAISTMGVVLYHLMIGKDAESTGVFFTTYLAPLLALTLPGIDANDEKKTVSTLRLYFHLFSWLPLVNDTSKDSAHVSATKRRSARSTAVFDAMAPSLFADITDTSADVDQKLWELGALLEDWTLALVDRCFEFIKSRVGQTEGASQSSRSAKRSGASKQPAHDDPIVMEVLNMMGLLFLQMSPALYAQSVRKTLRFVSDVFFTTPFGGKVISQLIHICVQADPATSFSAFMALALEKLRVTKTEIHVATLMTNEKMWFLHVLDGVVRSNGANDRPILQYQDEVRVVLAHFLHHEDDKELYETAGTVLDHVLESLVNVYPTEFRSLAPAAWASAVADDSGMFQFLGAAVTWKDVAIAWHEPSAAELAFAFALLDAHVVGAFRALAAAQAAADRSVRTWAPRLNEITNALHGAKNVIVACDASESSLLARGALPLLQHALATDAALLDKFVTLRASLMRETHDVVAFWQRTGTGSTTEIQIWQALIGVIHELLIGRGDGLDSHRHRNKQHKYTKATTLDVASDALRAARIERTGLAMRDQAPLSSRNEMIERVIHFYAKRKHQEHFALAHRAFATDDAPHRALYDALLQDLETLMQNAYDDVRADAAAVMREMAELFPKWYYSRIAAMLAVLEGADGQAEVTDERIAGVVNFLSRSVAIKFVWKHRDAFYGRVVSAVLKSNDALLKRVADESKKLKVGARVEAFFMSVLASWRYVRTPAPSTALIETLLAAEPLASEHWKLQLVHLVSLYPLLQPNEVPLPRGVWTLVVKQLTNDVLPVRQVALALFAQLVQLTKHSPTDNGDVLALLLSCETLTTLVDAFVANHKNLNRFAASADGQHANSAPSNWSFGVDDVLNALSVHSSSYPRPAPLSTVRLLNQSRSTFAGVSVNSSKLVQKLVQIDARALFASGVVAHLHTLARDKTDAKISQEERQAALSTLAEWITGLLRGLVKTDADNAAHVAAVVEIVKTVLPHVSVSLVEPWGQVLYLVARTSRKTPALPLERLAPLVTYILDELEQSFARATAEDYARQVKWLVLVEALAVHILSASAAPAPRPAIIALAATLSARVIAVIDAFALTHQYKIIRDRVGKLLFLLGAFGFAPKTSALTTAPVDAATLPLAKLVAAAALDRDEAANSSDESSESDEAKTALYARETAMQWLSCTETHGDVPDLLAVMPALFPVAFLSQNHPKAEVAVFAKNTTDAMASSLRLYDTVNNDDNGAETDLTKLLALLEGFARHRFWKTRGAVLRFLTTFAFYHWVFFSREQRARVQSLVCAFLSDEQREVQEMAKYTLRSLVHHQRPAVVAALSADWTAQAQAMRVLNPKTQRRIARLETEAAASGAAESVTDELASARLKLKTNEDAMVRSVLGMCAIVLAFPHTVPPFVPPMFEELGRFLYLKKARSAAVSYLEKAVKETLLEFKRTHQDNWSETKRTFSPAQLDVIEDVSISPGYYT